MNTTDIKVCSFDLFDTLITRNLDEPKDLFKLLEEKNKIENFAKNREEAEVIARQEKKEEEITLDDIYDCLSKIYKEINLDIVKEEEINAECSICEFNENARELYNKIINSNKKIIITTDMYLPYEIIEKIINKNNIKYDKLYVSSELKLTKRSGNLFKYIFKDLNIQPNQLLHIGDNKKSDYCVPKKLGVNVKLFENKININHIDLKNNSYKYKALINFLNNRISKNYKILEGEERYYKELGYEILGSLLYSFCYWLNEKLEEDKIEKVFFLARDGKIMKKAFDIMYNNENAKYMYSSRRSLIVPTLWKITNNIEDLKTVMNLDDGITIKSFLKRIGLDSFDLKNILTKYGFTNETEISIKNDKVKEFYKEIYPIMVENSKEEFQNLKTYLENIGFYGKVAIVDIGWFGNMQYSLNKLINETNKDTTINGYYIGVMHDSPKQFEQKMNGFLFENNKNLEIENKKRDFNAIFEFVFSTNEGSTKRFLKDSVELYDYEYKNQPTETYLNQIQEGAIKFVEDFKNSGLSKYLVLNEIDSISNFIEFGNNPSKEDIKYFENFTFFDFDYVNILPNKNGWYYLTHLKDFIKDYKKSIWKTAFLKKILPLKINYYNVLDFLRKLKSRR